MTQFRDLSRLAEDDRLRIIGDQCMAGEVVGVVIEREQLVKQQRYIQKITSWYPEVECIEKSKGSLPKSRMLKFKRKVSL